MTPTSESSRAGTTSQRPTGGSRSSGDGFQPDAVLLALSVVILCYVWRIQDLLPLVGSLQLPLLSAAAAAGLYVLNDDRRRRLAEVDGPILRLLGGLAVVMVVGAPFALLQGTVFTFFTRDFVPVAVLLTGLTAAATRSEADLRWLAGVHVLGAAIFCFFALFMFGVGAGGRLGSLVYYDANGLGMLIVITIPLTLFFLLRGRDLRSRLLAGGCLLLFLATLVKTGSRGAFVGACVVGAWILVRYSAIPLGRRLATLAAAVLVLGMWGSDDYWTRMQTLLTPTQDYNWAGESESGRIEVWKRGVGYMLDHPLVGVGARNFNEAEGRISRRGQLNRLGGPGFKWSAAHNSFVQIGAETGVVGLLLFIALLFQGFRIAGRSPPPSVGGRGRKDSEALRQALRVCLVGYLVTGFFLSAAYDPILYALLGLLAGLAKVDRQTIATGTREAGSTIVRKGTEVYRLVRKGGRRRAS